MKKRIITNKALTFFCLVLTLMISFAGCANSPPAKHVQFETELDPVSGQILLRNGIRCNDMITARYEVEDLKQSDFAVLYSEGEYYITYIPDLFKEQVETGSYFFNRTHYLNRSNIQHLSNSIVTDTNESGEYKLFDAENSYSENIALTAFALSHNIDADGKEPQSIMISFINNLLSEQEYLKRTESRNELKETSVLSEVNSPLFDTSFIETYTYPGIDHTYYKFYGYKELDILIEFYDFTENATTITDDNLSSFINQYAYREFTIEFFFSPNNLSADALLPYEMTLDELQKFIDSIQMV